MTYQQYLDYTNIKKAITTYNLTYSLAKIHLKTPEGTITLPATCINNAKVVIDHEQLRKDYPTYTDVVIESECLIESLPSINSILNLPSDTFKTRINFLKERLDLKLLSSDLVLTEPQFNYLISGNPSVLESNH